MLKVRRIKTASTQDIENALTDLPENSFRQLIPLGKAIGNKELYLVVFELTEEQAENWVDTYKEIDTPPVYQFMDY